MKEETLGRGPKGGGKEELGEGEWVSFNTLSLRKTKVWQDYLTSLELKKREEMGIFFFFFFGSSRMKEMGVYIVMVKKIWMEGHLMGVDKESWTQTSF